MGTHASSAGPHSSTSLGTLVEVASLDYSTAVDIAATLGAFHDPLPVTLQYAKVLSRVVKRMNRLGSQPYQFRFFM